MEVIDSTATYLPRSLGDVDQEPEVPEMKRTLDDSFIDLTNNEIIQDKAQLENVLSSLKDTPDLTKINTQDSIASQESRKRPQFHFVRDPTPAERIESVNNGNFITKCLDYPIQDLSKGENEPYSGEIRAIIAKNYKRTHDGSLEVWNQDLLKRQKQVLGSLIKQFGNALFSGKSIMNISLPVTIFEPRSQIEREANNFLNAPYFLGRAGSETLALEQFKLTVAYFVSTLHLGTNPQKPFNPILGETFQGIIGGCPVYGEQISHHPPCLALQMLGKNFTMDGVIEFTASVSMNSVRSRKMGYLKIQYPNTGNVIRAQYPAGMMHGTAIGKRTFRFAEKFYIFDIENRYYVQLDLDTESQSMKKRAKMLKAGKDYLYGLIWRINDQFAEVLREAVRTQQSDVRFDERYHAVEIMDSVEGEWMEDVKIGNQEYWRLGDEARKLQYFDNPLPSDSNYRLDLLYLKAGDEVRAQEYKVMMEELQRKDVKLRKSKK